MSSPYDFGEFYWLYNNLHELKNNTADVEIFKSQIRKAWQCIDQENIRRLVASIPVQLDACRNVDGWYTKY